MMSYNETAARLNGLVETYFSAYTLGQVDVEAPLAMPRSTCGWILASVRRMHDYRQEVIEYFGTGSYLAEVARDLYIIAPEDLFILNGVRRELTPTLQEHGLRSYLDQYAKTNRLLVKDRGRDTLGNWIAVSTTNLRVTVGHSFTGESKHASFDLLDPGSIGQVVEAVRGLLHVLVRFRSRIRS